MIVGMMMLRLPPALRVALALRFSGPSGHRIENSIHSQTASKVSNIQNVTSKIPTWRRCYATVHAEDTDKVWSQHGNDVASNAPGASHISKETSNDKQDADSAGTSVAALPHESDEKVRLLAILRHRLKNKTSSRRSRLRQRINTALESITPVAALNQVAYGHLREAESRIATKQSALGTDENEESPAVSEEMKNETTQLLDLDYIQRSKALPTKADYPTALPELFRPTFVAAAVHNACSKLKISMQAETSFASKKDLDRSALQRIQPGLERVAVCTLKLDIPDICQEIAVGEGISKQAAKSAAWLHMVSKLHLSGTLKDLLPSDTSVQPIKVEVRPVEDFEPVIEPTQVDEQTMKEEKDAKTEIYNYAASFGLVPHFQTTLVQPRRARPRLRRTPKQPNPLYQVTIRLGEQGINVSATGKSIQMAEVAAALAFKREAEKQYTNPDNGMSTPCGPFSVLNVETAHQFFEFYKNRQKGVSLEIEHETLEGAAAQNSARLTVNGTPTGQAAIMQNKKQAESIAYLTAAVEMASQNPTLLPEFKQMLKKGKGKVLRALSSIDLQIDADVIQKMRTALIEAREAGLPDARQALNAETLEPDRESNRISWRLSTEAHEVASSQLHSKLDSFDKDPNLHELRSKKAALPMNHYRDQVLKMIQENQYSIVIGATGSGKTTQVPQILFEDIIKKGNGSACNIVCTQPRRIAATSVAQRVAAERDEPLRDTIGYHVRFDAKYPLDPYGITYCTTGVLLERMKHEPDDVLDTSSHIIIDEVHERDLNIDFLMIVLKQAIRMRKADGRPTPKVVLMSATLDSDLFARYFRQADSTGHQVPCPSLNVPGRTYPVQEKFLGSIMHELFQHRGTEVKMLLEGDPKTSDYLKAETAFSASRSTIPATARSEPVIDWKGERRQVFDTEEDASVKQEKEDALVPIPLLAATIANICSSSKDGAILAFVPGLEEILETEKLLLERKLFGINFADTSRFQLCLLHSSVPKEQQAAVFQPSPPGCRKIILSTNIAETSVTVPEVKYVIDTGKLREKRYDQVRRITKLQCVWESKSNSKQRAGRAGRVQDGFYYALFSKERAESLRAVGLPELLRSDLQETCLSVKSQKFGESVASFLGQAIEPPSTQAINAAIGNLITIEAFTMDENLTALGRVLAQLPVHPTLGKMIILGVIFKCLDPMIVLGAAAEERSLFVNPLGLREEANRAHRAYAGDSPSDHIALLNAFDELRTIRDESGVQNATQRARESFLHMGAFRVIDATARQIEGVLEQSGLIVKDEGYKSVYGPTDLNWNAKNYELIKGLLLAGFHPNLAAKTASNGVTHRTPGEQSVLMHPSSLNAEQKKSDTKYPYGSLVAYSSLSKSTDGNTLFLRDSTRVTALMAVLFGGQLRMPGDGRLEMDEWLPFFVKSVDRQFSTKLVLEFRKALDRVLNGAFRSLSDLSERERGGGLASDPICEMFASRVVEVLDRASGRRYHNAWPR